MAKIFSELFEPTSLSPDFILSRRESKRYFGKITISETEAKDGDYRSLLIKSDLYDDERLRTKLSEEFSRALLFYFGKYRVGPGDKVLVAGLGNEHVTADALGCAVVDRLVVTSHLYDDGKVRSAYGNLSAVKCGVSGTTGIESFSLLSAVVGREKPKIVLAVDALACGKTERLGRVIQLSDAGIEPGGGVANAKPILNERSLGVPVVAIGVPTVMYARKILAEFAKGDFAESDALRTLTVAAKEIDYQIRAYADVIADGINEAVHGKESRQSLALL
ncbi:MAG: GPR endopeptidase [Clostridia bacterium]|nr:GPR endopeptidase [Clostridia bacterium]